MSWLTDALKKPRVLVPLTAALAAALEATANPVAEALAVAVRLFAL